MVASISEIGGWFRTCLGSNIAWLSLSLFAIFATVAVGIGLYLEYEPYEIRITGLAKTRKLTFARDFPVKRQYAPSKKRFGSFLVVARVILEGVLGVFAFTSATIRETDSQARILSLQKELLPRHIDVVMHAVVGLQAFAGGKLAVVVVQDLESRRLLLDLLQLLISKCHWLVSIDQDQPPSLIPDGIEIVYRTEDIRDSPNSTEKAAEALSGYLNLPEVKVDNQVERVSVRQQPDWWPVKFNPPVNTGCLFIGLKPVGIDPEIGSIRRNLDYG